ncbi:MAG: acetyl-CoA carboxylase biotin carboxylase subunit [bacterium]
MFSKILIANRGEIALRVIRACKELGIKTVAVYSESDINSLHVRFADEAICIGPPEAYKSYLNIPSIISAAEITDAEAIHPGYGFLSENHRFVEICETCKIKFIGPSLESIKQMGDKARAREIMESAGIPVIPGSGNAVDNDREASEIAHGIGFPVIIKAAGGGGGKGMRVVHTDASFLNAFMTAQAEAISSFDNPRLYIEKLVEQPRHIEFQILGDHYGNIIHLGERDCSTQRRYQKLIEESPSTGLTPKLREKMGEAAIKAARAVNYYSTGTIEFLLDKNGNFYFMEMNTRIQVEHPVTELVTGIDLIKEQIKVAAGERLSFSQDDILIRGHAIECRINAENPKSFTPCPGTISSFHLPGGPGVRVDTAAYLNCRITPYYDSLIAKLIAHGSNRQEAISRMHRALEEFIIEGIDTTIPFHIEMLKNKDFIDGNINTEILHRLDVG